MAKALPLKNFPSLSWRSACGLYQVRILRKPFLQMREMAIKHAPIEVGTVLVGKYSPDGHTAIILSLAPLTDDSRGGRWSFIRGVRGLTEFFLRLAKRFRGQRYRVGEWHSHPDEPPVASGIDDETQTAIADSPAERCPEIVLVIIGGDLVREPTLGVYVYSRTRGRVVLVSLRPHG